MKKALIAAVIACSGCTEIEQEQARIEVAKTARQGAEQLQKTLVAGKGREAEPATEIKPDYPISDYRQGHEGTVWLVIETNPGNIYPKSVKLGRTSGYRSFDEAAIAEAKKTIFITATAISGLPIESVIDYPVDFRLPERR